MVFDTVELAQRYGIVDAAVRHNLLHKGFADMDLAADHINSVYLDPTPSFPGRP